MIIFFREFYKIRTEPWTTKSSDGLVLKGNLTRADDVAVVVVLFLSEIDRRRLQRIKRSYTDQRKKT